ncbi:hypothetical protein DEO72_LG10g2377 [Vigna unguiculata]|uniref:Uncharacterized protein n=1 Tax=Vigna unguiculata TaxID=3917 RepID=A0A4D6NEI6_VIGUN|nr:hypothetical protein DEO72_LG10g2377 [Vigna unguiculata]
MKSTVWKENVTPDSTSKTYLSLNVDTDVQNKRIQSTIRKPLFELTYCELEQNNGKDARRKRKLIINQKLAEKKSHGSTSIGSTNAPILQNSNSNNKGIVQFDCPIGRSKINVFNTELLPKEIVGSSSSYASLNSSVFSEVVNPFYVQQHQSHGLQFCQPSREQAIRSISKILDFDNNSEEDENDDNIIGHFKSDLYSKAEIQV